MLRYGIVLPAHLSARRLWHGGLDAAVRIRATSGSACKRGTGARGNEGEEEGGGREREERGEGRGEDEQEGLRTAQSSSCNDSLPPQVRARSSRKEGVPELRAMQSMTRGWQRWSVGHAGITTRTLIRTFITRQSPPPPPPPPPPPLVYSEEVLSAMAENKPIVALESTIISHGMPYPSNYDMALEVEEVVRAGGAVPATIAILQGQIHVGTSREALHILAERGQRVRKTATRDLPLVLSSQQDGATTVSSTMRIASMAGIRVFVTGGIGGVHRGVEVTGDVSADLTELSASPVTVVCAGAKSILDIPRTLEFLEMSSVPVMSYQSDFFPAFFTRSSGCRSQVPPLPSVLLISFSPTSPPASSRVPRSLLVYPLILCTWSRSGLTRRSKLRASSLTCRVLE
eukprot:763564-Hanusia_phi.AAC.2